MSAAPTIPARRGPPARGFTLIELMLAMVLASLVTVTLLGWVGRERGTATRLEAEADAVTAAQLVERLVRDDVLQAVIADGRRLQGDGGSLRLVTGSRSGDEEPALATVTWTFAAAEGALLRTRLVAGRPAECRVVTRRLRGAAFEVAGNEVACTWSDPRGRSLSFRIRFSAPGAAE